MIKTSIDLQDLRRRIYIKAKADKSWRFWGLYVHICKMETLHEAYLMAKRNKGAPGLDGVTFEDIERDGVEADLIRGLVFTHSTGNGGARVIGYLTDNGSDGYTGTVRYEEYPIPAPQ